MFKNTPGFFMIHGRSSGTHTFLKRGLDPHEVGFACPTEMQYLRERDVQEDPTGAEARAPSGRNPFGLESIDTNKGCAGAPRHRSRLVCMEVRHKGIEPVLSATPLLGGPARSAQCLRVRKMCSNVVNPFLIFIADVSRAHFYAYEVRDVHVSLPYENSKSKGPGGGGKMPKTLHGALVAALTVVRASSTSWYVNKPRPNYEQLQFRPGIT